MSLLAELKRRHVFKVAAAYAVAAWVAIQVGATVSPLLSLPDWVPKLVVLLAVLGFPAIVIVAWIYDIGDKGVEKTAPLAGARPSADAAAPPAPAGGGRISSIAVLPLEEVDAATDDPLADGLTEALITELARASQLKVISRSSVARLKGSPDPPRLIAQRLGVDALVTGSVRRNGSHIRISVELIDPTSERLRWADRFDREMADVLRLQDEVARAISREVQAHASPAAPSLPPPRRVVPEAYMLDLKGRRLMESRTEEGFRSALACFQQALDADPTYGASYVGIARAHNMLANYGIESPAQANPRVRAAVARALELGANEAETQGEVALALWQFDFDWDGADQAYERALVSAPNDARLWYWRGTMLAVSGRFDAGLEALARSEQLDPLSPMVPANRGWTYYFARRLRDSIATLREVLALNPDLAPAHWFLGMALSAQGEHVAAIKSYEASIARTGRISRLLGYLGHALGRAGRLDEARALLQELRQRAETTYVPPYFEALVLAGLGEREQALGALELGLSRHDAMLRDLRVDASFDELRGEPRFKQIIAALHLDRA